MVTFDGSKLLVNILQNNKYYQIEGITKTKISLTNQYIEQATMLNSDWKEVLERSGKSSLKLEIEGLYSGSFAEKILINSAFKKRKEYFNIFFDSEDIISGDFFITNYIRVGNINEAETYSLTLISASNIKYFFNKQLQA